MLVPLGSFFRTITPENLVYLTCTFGAHEKILKMSSISELTKGLYDLSDVREIHLYNW